jgi:hypothetical protein
MLMKGKEKKLQQGEERTLCRKETGGNVPLIHAFAPSS